MAFKLPKFTLFKKSAKTPELARTGRYELAKTGKFTAKTVNSAVPLLGRLSAAKQLQLLGGVLVALLLVTAISAFIDKTTAGHDARYVSESGKMLMLSQRLAKNAQLSLSGDPRAFDDLTDSWESFDSILTLLEKGDDSLPATSGDTRVVLEAMRGRTGEIRDAVAKLQAARPSLEALEKNIASISASEVELRDLIQQLEAGPQRERAARLSVLLEQIARDAAKLTASGGAEGKAGGVDTIAQNRVEAEALLKTFPAGDPLSDKVISLSGVYLVVAQTAVDNEKLLHEAKYGVNFIVQNSDMLMDFSHTLVAAYLSTKRPAIVVMGISGVLVVLLLLLVVKVYLGDTRRRAQQAERTNRSTQESILRLMNELSDLAEGDLTISATVSEDVTGAIADSVNYTVDELRKLVVGITTASNQVTRAAGKAAEISTGLLTAAERQSKELSGASEAVQLITQSIQEVDGSASQSAQVARRTLVVTEQGAQAVQDTIAGMNSIREQIQETSKRIKRLGESSQEIGEIVDLISDITEQTNVLALNAAIQAASAGEAGRGFSVVAEEVQRLAERSAEATKQIGALVKTIQSDTQDAVAAMEKSTQGVVEGAKLSDAAGQSLREIEQVSRELAQLISSISVSTQVQTDMAREVANSMTEILHITEQTTTDSKLTNASVSELAALASDLKNSVSGFKV